MDEILDLTESVSEGFPTYSYKMEIKSIMVSCYSGDHIAVDHIHTDISICAAEVVVVLLFYVNDKQLWSSRDGQLT